MKRILLALSLFLPLSLQGQVSSNPILTAAGAPSNPCPSSRRFYVDSTNNTNGAYYCGGDTNWHQLVGSGGGITLDAVGNLAATATNTFVGTNTWTLAGGVTAAATDAVTITNASASNNSSGALAVTTTGAGTAQIPLVVNEGTSSTGDITDFQNNAVNKVTIGTGGVIRTAGGTIGNISNGSALTVQAGLDGSAANGGTFTGRGGDITSGALVVNSGPAVFRGGDNASTGTAVAGGALTLRAGNATGAASSSTGGNASLFSGSSAGTTPTEGLLQSGAYFKLGTAIANAGDIVCVSATTMSATDCATTPAINYVGIALNTTAPIQVVMYGEALVNTSAAAVGNQVCLGTVTAGVGTAQAGACTASQGVGVVISITEQGASSTKPLVALNRY